MGGIALEKWHMARRYWKISSEFWDVEAIPLILKGKANRQGGIAPTSKNEGDIFSISRSHSYAISIAILGKCNTPFLAIGGIDQYPLSSQGEMLINTPPWHTNKIVFIGGFDQYSPSSWGKYWPIYLLDRFLILSCRVNSSKYPVGCPRK